MKYTLHIVDVFGRHLFGGNQLAVLTDAAGISTEGTEGVSMGAEAKPKRRRGSAMAW